MTALLAAAALAGGCGTSTPEETQPRDPSGLGQTRTPDVAVENVDDLRAVEVVVAARRFQPQQVSVGLDSVVRIENEGPRVAQLRKLRGPGGSYGDKELQRGEELEIQFLEPGVAEIGLKGSRARLQINILPQ